jgi:hypothetical protein
VARGVPGVAAWAAGVPNGVRVPAPADPAGVPTAPAPAVAVAAPAVVEVGIVEVGDVVGTWKKVRVGAGSGGAPPQATVSGTMRERPRKRRREIEGERSMATILRGVGGQRSGARGRRAGVE